RRSPVVMTAVQPSRPGMPLLPLLIVFIVRCMGDLFDAAAMYDEDYLHFSPRLMTAASWPRTGPSFLALIFRVRLPRELAWRLAELRPGMTGGPPAALSRRGGGTASFSCRVRGAPRIVPGPIRGGRTPGP